ncbi:MAG: tape measure protein [Pseudomonas sp.]|uniref:tape measure protein n=1 Tax=Pseudomonas sp. TaxID=306 RepID=UPI003D6EDAE1
MVGSFIKQADAYGQMASRLKMVTGSTAEYNAVQKQLMEISDRTYKPLEEQQELFIRSSKSMKELGYSTKDTIDFIDSASSALTINAATSEKGSQAIDALSKAMITGKLGGDEWNAVLEIIPTTVGDLAKSMGKSETAVKQMAAEGKLQTKVYVDALIAAQAQNAKLAEDMPTTVGDSLTKLSNHFSAVVGEINGATGATGVFSGVIDDLSAVLADGEVTAGAIEGFTNWMTAIKTVAGEISSLADQINDFVGDATDSSFSIGEAFSQMPINLRAAVQIAVVEVAHFIDNVLNQAQAATAYLKALPQGLEAASAAYDSTRAQMAANDQARSDTIDGIFAERDALLATGKAAGDAYREQHKALGTISTERTAAVKTLTDEEKKAQKAAADAAAALAKSQAKALADLKAQSDIAIASATGLAAAYLAGTDKSRDFALQQKVEEALLKTGAGARDKVTKAINDMQDAQDRLAVSKQAYDLQQETTDLIAQAKATLMGTDALEAYNVEKAMQVALAGKNIEVGSKEYQQLLDATKAQQDAVKVAKQAGDAGSIMDRLYPQSKLLRDYTEDQKSLNAAMVLYPEHAAEYQAALQRLGVEYEQNKNAATEWGKFTEGAVDRIDEAFANMWESVLSKSGDFMDTLKNSFRQFLAEMLHMAITKPIIVQIGSALGVGGLAASDGGSILSGLTGGGTGIMSYLNTAKNVMSVAGSKFSESIMSGWNSGDGVLGGLQNAFSSGADYVQSAITSAFSTGSATVAQITTESVSQSLTSALATGTENFAAQFGTGISQGGSLTGAAASSTLSSSLATLGSVLGYVQGAVSIFQSFQDYGLKGGAVSGGMAAAGAYIGSFVGPLGTAAGFAIGATLGSLGAGKLFGSGEKYPDLSTSATGRYINGQYTDTGIAPNWQTNAPKYGSAADAQMSSTLNKFSTTLGMLYDTLGNGADVVAYNTLQQRKTSGKYSTTFGAQLDDGSVITGKQQFKADDIAAALTADYDDIMGTFLAKAIVSSKSLPDYFKAQFTDFANSWDTTADEVIKAIEGVFTRFNGVNDALSLINVNNLKLDDTGLQASDSILNMVGAMSDLDTATATAKEKVDALNTAVGTYYQAFFTADEQFADLTKSLQDAFAGFGLELPDNRPAYRDMVEDIDVTTAAGQAMFATMMGLATNAKSYYSTLEQKAKDAEQAAADAAQKIIDGLMGNASSAFSAVQRSITAQQKMASDAYNALTTSLNDMLSTANTNVSDLTGVSNDLSSALKALRGDSDDAVKMLRAQATATLQSALATAKAGGSLAGFAGLSDALDTVSNNSTDLYASLEDFNRDQGRTANVVAELNALNGKQLTSAQQTVKTLQDQLDQAKKAYDAQMAQFDAQLAYAQSQLDALNGVDNSILGVTAAVNAMNAAVVAALSALPRTGAGSAAANTAQNNGTIIDSVYQSILGRDADAAGRNYWLGELANGHIAYDQLAQAVANAAREKGQAVVAPGYATGGLISGPGTGTSDSILARLSNGEFVMNADAVRMFGPDLLSQMNGLQIPAFAVGGPVLDVTGPSQVFAGRGSPSGSSSGGDAATVSELRGLRSEMKANFEYISKYIKETADNTDDIANGVQIHGTVSTKAVSA